MKNVIVCSTVVLGLLGLAEGCSSSSSSAGGVDSGSITPTDSGASDSGASDSGTPVDAGPPALVVETYTSSATGEIDIQVNSHLVMGATEALLVDGQLLAADAQAVVKMVTQSGRTLKTVFLTHAHPDHYSGFAVIQAAFPGAQFVATPAVLADFEASAPGTFMYLQSVLGNLVAAKLVTPTALSASSITIDGQVVNVVQLGAGESAHLGALALPGGRLLSGDLLYDEVHLYLGECHSAGWQTNLTAVQAMGFTTFYPGHGKAPVDATIFAADAQYIAGAVPILAAAEAADAGTSDAGDPRVGLAIQGLEQKFPSFKSNYLVGFSASTFIDTNKCP